MKPFNFQQPIWTVIRRNLYFPLFMGIFMGIFCSDLYETFTGKDFFNIWHDRLFGIIYVSVGIYGLISASKKSLTPFLLDTLGGLALIGTGVYLIFS